MMATRNSINKSKKPKPFHVLLSKLLVLSLYLETAITGNSSNKEDGNRNGVK